MFPIFNHPNQSRYLSGNTFLSRPRRKSASSLLRDLVAHWSLEEASGVRHDALGNHDLTPHGSPAQVQGHLDYAVQFDPDTSDYLSVLSHPELQPGASDFTMAGWFLLDFIGAAPLIGKWDPGALEYLVGFDGTSVYFSASANGSNAHTVSSPAALEGGRWYHFAAWHDAANETLNLSVDNGAPATQSHTGGIYEGTADLNLGRQGVTGALLSGRLDSFSLWKRLLSDSERAQLFNGGSGLAYPF